jgi:hypothetical protein
VPQPGDFASFEINVYARRPVKDGDKPDPGTSATLNALTDGSQYSHASEDYIVTIAIPKDKTGLRYTYASTATGTLSIDPLRAPTLQRPPLKNAVIAWSAFSTGKGSYSLRGALSDAQSGTNVGYIYAGIGVADGKPVINNISISKNALAAIKGEDTAGPADYWASLPSCSNSGPFLPSGLNILQQLPGGVSSALQQQR